MSREIAYALIVGAVIVLVAFNVAQWRADQRLLITLRWEAYLSFYSASNDMAQAMEELALTLIAERQGVEDHDAGERLAGIYNETLRMTKMMSKFALISPVQLRNAARGVTTHLLGWNEALKRIDPDRAKEEHTALINAQVHFVNQARRDLGITPRWKIEEPPRPY